MKELLKVLKFDCELERFAEVFGDEVEFEDCDHFQRVAPFTLEELNEERLKRSHFYNYGSPNFEFECIDCVATAKLNEARQSAGLEPKDLFLVRAFFRFVNDAYKWDDLEDLERWETELFDALNGYQQKNYKPLDLKETEQSRFNLFLQFNRCLKKTYGEAVAFQILQTVEDDLSPRERVGLNLGLI